MALRFPKIVGVTAGLSFLLFGVWAMAAPESFFDRIALFEPYNQHLFQDVGAFQIGLGAVLLLASLRPQLPTMPVALFGTGAGATAHAVSHVIGRDLGGRPSSDIPTFVLMAVLLLAAGAVSIRKSA